MKTTLPSTIDIELDGITNIGEIEYIEIPDVYIFPYWGFKIYYNRDYKTLIYKTQEEADNDRNWLIANK